MKILFPIALLLAQSMAQACSFAPGHARFVPAIAAFEARQQGVQADHLPAPTVGRVAVQRGTAAPGASCGDAGTLTLELAWPKTGSFKLGEVGFFFRVLSGRQPDRIFPLYPITGKIVGGRARFSFVWLDGHPSEQAPLDLEVEVFAVNKGLEIGASRRFRVKH